MAYQKKDFSALENFMPANCFDDIFSYIKQYNIQLSITPQRKSIHGNYKHNFITKTNAISVNGTLNQYAFIITLIHEIAHCICMNAHGRKALPHGQEWQNIYSQLLIQFTAKNIFPDDILHHLQNTIRSPKASSCGDPQLEKVLVKYNKNAEDRIITYVEDLATNDLFSTPEGKIFRCLEKRRTRYLCEEIKTKKKYLFPAIYQIQRVEH
jgi:SprT protein